MDGGREMTRRVLPPHEWSRLADNEQLGPVLSALDPLTCSVLVVEHDDRIVGCWAFLHVLHAEGVYVDPDLRAGGVVARHLWRGAQEIATEQGAAAVWAGADRPQIANLLLDHGARKFPVDSYVLPFKGES